MKTPLDLVGDSSSYYKYFFHEHNYGESYIFLEIIPHFVDAVERYPTDDDAFYNLGVAAMKIADEEAAVFAYSQSIILNDRHVNAFINRGNVYRARGQVDDAIEDYTQAIMLSPEDARAYYNRGCAYEAQNLNDNARSDFRVVLLTSSNGSLRAKARQRVARLRQ